MRPPWRTNRAGVSAGIRAGIWPGPGPGPPTSTGPGPGPGPGAGPGAPASTRPHTRDPTPETPHQTLHQRPGPWSNQRPDHAPETDHAKQREVTVAPHDALQSQNQSRTGPMPRTAPAITQASSSRRSVMLSSQKRDPAPATGAGSNRRVSAYGVVESSHPTKLSLRQLCRVAPVLSGAVLSGSSNLRPTLSGR